MTIRKFAIAAALCALPLSAFAAGGPKPGKWQTTVETEIAGMPQKMPAHTSTHCITPEDAAHPDKLVPQMQQNAHNSGCSITDVKQDGSTVSWKMTCEKAQMTGEGHMTYATDSFTGAFHMKTPQYDVSTKYSGKYLGACDGEK
jgi:hypothetical protein